MSKNKSFSLVEAIVSIAIIALLAVAFTPGLTRHQQQLELERTTQQLTNALLETRSLAVSPTNVTATGKVMQFYIMILNISGQNQRYVTQWRSGGPYAD